VVQLNVGTAVISFAKAVQSKVAATQQEGCLDQTCCATARVEVLLQLPHHLAGATVATT
jgi:hypothetical protein